ncbi:MULTISPECIES: hypothetical protein [unclassified Frankia]
MLYLAGQILAYVLVAMLIGAALAWVFLIAPLRRQARNADADAARNRAGSVETPAGTGLGLDESRPGAVPSADQAAAANDVNRVNAGNAAEAGNAVAACVGDADTGVPGSGARGTGTGQAAELIARLRRQRDDVALEKADLTARLAVAEQRAAESERRIAEAERHAVIASARVEEIEAAMRARAYAVTPGAAQALPAGPGAAGEGTVGPGAAGPVPAGSPGAGGDPAGPSAAELAHEAELLRRQLVEAEGRAAKFSSRLAMARTEAEDAQRQVATMTTRLDRHQAEWAAERLSLLGRIAKSEALLGQASSDEKAGAEHPEAAPTAEAAVAVGVAAAGGVVSSNLAVTPNEAGPSKSALPAHGLALSPGANISGATVQASGVATKNRPPAPGGPPSSSQGSGCGVKSTGGRSTGGTNGASGQPGTGSRVVLEPAPRWNGLLDPVRSGGDNLKEIVGVGPVIEARLRALGITTFSQLAEMGDTDVERLAHRLDGFGDRIVSDDWVGQAQDLQARHYGGVY